MPFMQPETYHGEYYVISANHGETTFVPCDIHPNASTNAELSDYAEGAIDDPNDAPIVRSGWMVRWSAAGYMDCTPWTWYDAADEDEALRMFADDEDVCQKCFESHDDDTACDDDENA